MERELTQERILVWGGDDLELLGLSVISEPAPSRALDSKGLGVEFLLEFLKGTEVVIDGFSERARLEDTPTRADGGEIGPEEGVVDVAWK